MLSPSSSSQPVRIIGLKRCKHELRMGIMANDKLHRAFAKVANAIKQNDAPFTRGFCFACHCLFNLVCCYRCEDMLHLWNC